MSERLYETLEITDLKDMLAKSGKLYQSCTAYKIKKEDGTYFELTHGEVRDMVNALGTALLDMGLGGKRIAVIGENLCEHSDHGGTRHTGCIEDHGEYCPDLVR